MCASNLAYSISMWLMCSWLNIYISNWDCIITHLPFTTMPSIMVNSCLMGQYLCMTCITSSFLCVQPLMIYTFSSYRWTFLAFVSCILQPGVHTCRSTAVLIPLTFMLSPCISLSLISSHLSHDIQSTMNSSGPGLYSMYNLYWCMNIIINCRHCDNIATSFSTIAYQ